MLLQVFSVLFSSLPLFGHIIIAYSAIAMEMQHFCIFIVRDDKQKYTMTVA